RRKHFFGELGERRLVSNVVVGNAVYVERFFGNRSPGIDQPRLALDHVAVRPHHARDLDDAIDCGIAPGRLGVDRHDTEIRNGVLARELLAQAARHDPEQVCDPRVVSPGGETARELAVPHGTRADAALAETPGAGAEESGAVFSSCFGASGFAAGAGDTRPPRSSISSRTH